jgi:hypothetical protein
MDSRSLFATSVLSVRLTLFSDSRKSPRESIYCTKKPRIPIFFV